MEGSQSIHINLFLYLTEKILVALPEMGLRVFEHQASIIWGAVKPTLNSYRNTYIIILFPLFISRELVLFFVINGPAKQVNFKTIIMLFKIIVRRVVSRYKVEQNKHVSYYTLKQKQRKAAISFIFFVFFGLSSLEMFSSWICHLRKINICHDSPFSTLGINEIQPNFLTWRLWNITRNSPETLQSLLHPSSNYQARLFIYGWLLSL